jgi:hypothetical protein
MDVSVDYSTSDDTAVAGQDYDAASGSVTFGPNETEKIISIDILNDELDENDESFAVTLSNASHGSIQADTAIVTILDEDDAPSISISGNNNIAESENLDISVTLAQASGKTITIDLQSIDGQAVAGQDFNALSETVSFAPGETSKVVTLTLVDDAIDETNELFSVQALNPVNTFITSSDSAPNGVLSVLIEDNDDAPTINLSEDLSVSEDANTAVVEFNLSEVSGKRISFNYATQSTNQNASLFEARSGVINFEPGESSKSVSINLIDNNVFSGTNGEFTVQISNATNALIADDSTIVTIVEDEAKPTISIADVTVNEGDGPATLIITQSGRTSEQTNFRYRTNVGTASHVDGDYGRPTNGWAGISIPAGSLTQAITVNISDDLVYEGPESFFVEIYETSTPNLVDIGSGVSAEVTIIDNDPLPTVNFENASESKTEGGRLDTRFIRSGSTALDVIFDLKITLLDAEAEDYDVINEQITITPNVGSVNTQILTVVDDVIDEDK